MKPTPAQIQELLGLLHRMLDNELSQEKTARLEMLLTKQPALRQYYVRFFWLRSELHSCFSQTHTCPMTNLQGSQADLLAEMVDQESLREVASKTPSIDRIKSYADAELSKFLSEQERLRAEQKQSRASRSGSLHLDWRGIVDRLDSITTWAYRSLVGGAVCVTLILIGISLVQYYRSVRVVATLTDSLHAQWAVPPEANELSPGWMTLERGYAQLRLKSDAEVLIQAPCVFNPSTTNRILVEKGTLTAQVPPQATGFTVDTPNFEVVDFGTEFGVQVSLDQSTCVQVFQGMIEMLDANTRSTTSNHQLTQGQAANVDPMGQVTLGTTADQGSLFMREMPSGKSLAVPGYILDLADVVGGGNGFGTGQLQWGLDPQLGPISAKDSTRTVKLVPGYKAITSLPFVDGVFVPDRRPDRAQVISTTGLVFAECPDTSGYYSPSHIIINGARFQTHLNSEYHAGSLQGQTFATKEHPSLGMHANLGITFDLNRIRAAQPGHCILKFRALCGLSETVTQFTDGTYESHRITAGFWVLVDGRLVSSFVLNAVPHETRLMEVELPKEARFLTLVTTDNGYHRANTWAMFAEPILELAPNSFIKAF